MFRMPLSSEVWFSFLLPLLLTIFQGQAMFFKRKVSIMIVRGVEEGSMLPPFANLSTNSKRMEGRGSVQGKPRFGLPLAPV